MGISKKTAKGAGCGRGDMQRATTAILSNGQNSAMAPELPLLAIRGLTKKFGGLIAVNAVSFDVPRGGIVGLIGPNGAGKTTIFNLITGIYRPTSGDILFDGASIIGMAPFRIADSGITRTFQNHSPL